MIFSTSLKVMMLALFAIALTFFMTRLTPRYSRTEHQCDNESLAMWYDCQKRGVKSATCDVAARKCSNAPPRARGTFSRY